SATPLNVPKGRVAQWKVEEQLTDLKKSSIPAVRDIATSRNKANPTDAGNVKAAVDAALVIKQAIPTAPLTPDENRFAKVADVTKYQVVNTYEAGGSNPQFWKFGIHHTPKYAVAQYCQLLQAPSDRSSALPPITPQCDPSADAIRGYLVLRYDLGSLRVPPFVIFVTSG